VVTQLTITHTFIGWIHSKVHKNFVVLRDYHHFLVLLSDFVIRFPTRSHFTESEDRTCLLLEERGNILCIYYNIMPNYNSIVEF